MDAGITGPFTVNALNFTNTTNTSSTSGVTIDASPANTLTFDGTNPVVTLTGAGSATLTSNVAITLNQSLTLRNAANNAPGAP